MTEPIEVRAGDFCWDPTTNLVGRVLACRVNGEVICRDIKVFELADSAVEIVSQHAVTQARLSLEASLPWLSPNWLWPISPCIDAALHPDQVASVEALMLGWSEPLRVVVRWCLFGGTSGRA